MFRTDNPDNYNCPFLQNASCPEEDTSRIMQRFKTFYEKKMAEVDTNGGGDASELKLQIQQKWIEDLTEQTEMMARIIKELEDEATARVRLLEDSLEHNSKMAKESEDATKKLRKIEDKYCKDKNCLEEKVCCLESELDCFRRKLDNSSSCMDHGTMVDSCDLGPTPRELHLEEAVCKKEYEVSDLQCRCEDLQGKLQKTKCKVEDLKKSKRQDVKEAVAKKECDIKQLADRCQELEAALACSQGRAQNLQKAEEVSKLRQQVGCYQHVVDCFKHEMAVMSEQLVNLQEILNLSNQSCKEESEQLYNAVCELQCLSKRLNDELKESEKQVYVENQMSQMKDSKIDELQQLVSQKDCELNHHDQVIHELKLKLENAVIENHELQTTIVALNSTVMELQCCLRSTELEKCQHTETCRSQVTVCEKSITDFKENICKKNKRIGKLQCECQKHEELVTCLRKDLEKLKSKNKEKLKSMKRQVEELRCKLKITETCKQKMCEEIKSLRTKATELSQKDCFREHELTQCKQLALEVRQTLMEANECLTCVLPEFHISDEISAKIDGNNFTEENIMKSCRCEMNLYKKLALALKNTIHQTTRKMCELENRNKILAEEIFIKDAKIEDYKKKLTKREGEFCEYSSEMGQKLKRSEEERQCLKENLEKRKREASKIVEERSKAEDEIASMKCEMRSMIENQLELNSENDKLLTQVTRLQSLIAPLEEKNSNLREKLEKACAEITCLLDKNRSIQEEKKKLRAELSCLQCCNDKLTKMHKQAQIAVKTLEMELAEIKNNRDEVCDEGKYVVNNVKAWLNEQRKINNDVKKKAECYSYNMEKLKRENEVLINQALSQLQQKNYCTSATPKSNFKCSANKKCKKCVVGGSPEVIYQSPWTLGSQGTGSACGSPRDSPSSFNTCSIEEWYAPNYRDDDETDCQQDEDFIARIEALTNEMRCNNKKLKSKTEEFRVSKDEK